MEKRLALAIVLCVGFMLLWGWIFPPAKPKPPAAPETASGAAAASTGTTPATSGETTPSAAPAKGETPAAAAPTPAPAAAAPAEGAAEPPAAERAAILPAGPTTAASEETIAVDTPLVSIRMTSVGARVTSWILREFKDEKGRPLDLVSPSGRKLDHLPLDLLFQDEAVTRRVREAHFVARREKVEGDGGPATVLTFTWSDAEGDAAAKVLRIPDDSYVADLKVAATVGGKPVTPAVVWGAGFEHDGDAASPHMGVGARAVVRLGGKIDHRFQKDIKEGEPWSEEGPIRWAGLENKYFAAILVPQEAGSAHVRVETLKLIEDGKEQHHMLFSLVAPGATHFHLFVGPKDYDLLKRLGLGLDRLIDFGFFSIIALPLFVALKFVNRYIGNYGWSIVILTVFIRLLFFPFMHRSQLKMRMMQEKMKRIQPRIKSMRERYHKLERKEAEKGRAGARHRLRQEMNEEMMKIYKEEGVNPFSSMSGCLPLLAQMPILYAFYNILSQMIELRHAPFIFWVRDLSVKDPYYITPLLMGVTMLAQQLMTSSAIPDASQRRMMYIMPIMFTWFFINLPSGLVLYWLVNNLLGIVQQHLVNKEADAGKAAAAAGA